MKKTNLLLGTLISCLFISFYSIKINAADITGNENVKEKDIPQQEINTANADSFQSGSKGLYSFTGGDTSDYTSETITDTTDVVYNSDVMSSEEKKDAWHNWYASLFNETDAVLDSGYTNGKITRVLKSRMNIIPYQELTGFEWVEAENNDIGAVRFEDGGEWKLKPTMEINGWRI